MNAKEQDKDQLDFSFISGVDPAEQLHRESKNLP